MSSSACGSCGKASAMTEDEGHIVCTHCGWVQEETTSYQLDRGLEEYGQACHSGSSYNSTFASNNYRMRNANPNRKASLVQWTKYIHQICDGMQVKSKDMQKEAVNLFKSAIKVDRFRIVRSASKKALCASCVYVTCRRHDWPIRIIDLIGITDTRDDILKRLNQELIQELKIEIRTVSIEDYVPTCLRSHGVTEEALVERTIEVIALAKELWLDTGRHTVALVLASCCIAWQASTPANHKKSLPQFGRTVVKTKLPRLVRQRYKELTGIMVKMATKVPWVSNAMLRKENSWMFFLDDILRYKKSLLSDLEPPADVDCDGDDDESETEDSYVIAPPAFEASMKKRAVGGDEGVDNNCYTTTKSGHESSESMNNPELSEKDIPESELVMYIKTPKEVEIAKELALISDV